MKLVNIKKQKYNGHVYDICMAKNKNFLAEGFVVHNCAKSQYMMYIWNQEGVVYDQPKLVMKGIKAVKISTPDVCKKSLKEAFIIIMSGTEEDLQKHVKSFQSDFNKMKFHLISTPGGTNTMNAYPKINDGFSPKTPIGVKSAHTYNSMIDKLTLINEYAMIGQGDKIRYGYLKMPNPCQSNVIACIDELPDEFGLDNYIDYNTQFDKTYLDTLNPILDTVGWSVKKKHTLEGLFS